MATGLNWKPKTCWPIQHENDHLNGVTIMDRATHFYEDDYPEDTED